MTINHIFVYGSLRSGFKSPAYEYVSKYFTLITADAKVNGLLFDKGEYPVAVPTNTHHFIIGELYAIKNADEFSFAIAQLDDYEGLNTEVGETPLFRREATVVYTSEEDIPAWVYWYNGDITGKPIIESGDVLEYLKNKKS